MLQEQQPELQQEQTSIVVEKLRGLQTQIQEFFVNNNTNNQQINSGLQEIQNMINEIKPIVQELRSKVTTHESTISQHQQQIQGLQQQQQIDKQNYETQQAQLLQEIQKAKRDNNIILATQLAAQKQRLTQTHQSELGELNNNIQGHLSNIQALTNDNLQLKAAINEFVQQIQSVLSNPKNTVNLEMLNSLKLELQGILGDNYAYKGSNFNYSLFPNEEPEQQALQNPQLPVVQEQTQQMQNEPMYQVTLDNGVNLSFTYETLMRALNTPVDDPNPVTGPLRKGYIAQVQSIKPGDLGNYFSTRNGRKALTNIINTNGQLNAAGLILTGQQGGRQRRAYIKKTKKLSKKNKKTNKVTKKGKKLRTTKKQRGGFIYKDTTIKSQIKSNTKRKN